MDSTGACDLMRRSLRQRGADTTLIESFEAVAYVSEWLDNVLSAPARQGGPSLAMLLDALAGVWLKTRLGDDDPQVADTSPTRRELETALAKVRDARFAVEDLLPDAGAKFFGVEVRLVAALEQIAAEKQRRAEDEEARDVARPFAPDDEMNFRPVRAGRKVTPRARAEILLDGYLDLPRGQRDQLIAAIGSALFKPQTPEQVRQRLRGHRARAGRNSP